MRQVRKHNLVILAISALMGAVLAVTTALAQPAPEFKLGFKVLADQIPGVVGQPLENEHWGANGDSLQLTTNGMAAWRKADNWTAFTNGSRTWVNGPFGVMERGNDARFSWEAQKSPDQGLYLGKYRAMDTLEQVVDGKKYTLQTLTSPSASHTVVINEAAKATLGKFVADEGKRNGFENARIIVLGQDEQVEGVNMDWEQRLVQNKYEMIGFFGSQRLGQDVNLFYRTDTTTPFNNPDFMRSIGSSLSAKFVNMAVLGGSLDTNGMFGTAPTPEQLSRIIGTGNWYPSAFDLVPYSRKY